MTNFGQNGVKGDYFLLLNSKNLISLNTFENSVIVEHETFNITEKSIFTTDKKSRVAILDTGKNSVDVYDFKSSKEVNITIPFDLKPKTILLSEDNLFIGGKMGKEILVQYRIESNKWDKLEVPEEVQMCGKSVDDLVVNDKLLIAIDNLIMPKYILYYNLRSEGKLELSHFKKLKSNSSYENIHQGRITSKYLGLASKTMNHGNVYEHITIYSDLDLIKSFAISVEVKEKRNFNDFIIVGNKIFIANRSKGLGIFDIKKSYFKARKGRYEDFNFRVSENEVNYKQYKNEEIVCLTKISNEAKIVLTIKNRNGDIRKEVLDLKKPRRHCIYKMVNFIVNLNVVVRFNSLLA